MLLSFHRRYALVVDVETKLSEAERPVLRSFCCSHSSHRSQCEGVAKKTIDDGVLVSQRRPPDTRVSVATKRHPPSPRVTLEPRPQ